MLRGAVLVDDVPAASAAASRAIKPMRHPARANRCTIARPTPAEAPVTTTTRAEPL